MPNPRGDLKITVGSTTLYLTVKRDPQTKQAMFARYPAEPLNPIVSQGGELDYSTTNPKEGITLNLDDFTLGCGAFLHAPGRYAIARDADCRWGGIIPGPEEVVDLTGIAAGYRVVKRVLHSGVNWLVTTNNTNTKVYRDESSVWVEKRNVNSVVGTDIVSFKGVVAVALGASTAYQYSTDDGSSWVTSTKTTEDSDKANFFCVAQAATIAAKVWYVRNPNELYVTEDLTNTDGVGSGSSTVGDTNNDEFNSIVEDDTGLLLMGKRAKLYTIDSIGNVRTVAGPYRYIATSDAGTGVGMANFEYPVHLEGRIYYPVEDYRLIEYDHGIITEDVQPGAFGPLITRMQLPLNALVAVNGWLLCGLGTANPTTIKADTYAPGSSNLLINQLGSTTDFYAGRYINASGGRQWIWHGIIRVSSWLARYAWFDDANQFVYVADYLATNANESQRRFIMTQSYPLTSPTTGGNVILNDTWRLETGKYYANQPSIAKTLRKFYARTNGLILPDPYIRVSYRTGEDDESSSFITLATLTDNTTPRTTGVSFPAGTTFYGVRYQFLGVNDATYGSFKYPVLYNAQFTHLHYPPVHDIIEVTVQAVNGQMLANGVPSTLSWKEIRALLDETKDAQTPFTLTELETEDSWTVRLDSFREMGLGKDRVLAFVCHEVT